MAVTLYQIAQKAGVSISTVSRVLNKDPSKPASPKTAQRIIEAATELGYFQLPVHPLFDKPEPVHKIVCYLASKSDNYADNFFASIMLGIQEEALRLGYNITHTFSASSATDEAICEQIAANKPEAVVLLGRVNKKAMTLLKAANQTVIYVGLNKLNYPIDQVICDCYSAILQSVHFLVNCGFRRIGYLGTIPESDSTVLNEHRFEAFSDGMKLNGLNLNMDYCENIVLNTTEAYHAVVNMIRNNRIPEAFCCANDTVAIGAIRALTDCHFSVPEDVSVIGLDDIEMANYFQPRLTTFNMQTDELGKFCIKILDDRLKNGHTSCVTLELPSSLVVRDSCKIKSFIDTSSISSI